MQAVTNMKMQGAKMRGEPANPQLLAW